MPTMPSTPCAQPGCPNLRPCPTHPTQPWAGSRDRRRAITGLSGSAEQRRNRRTIRKHKGICHICHEPFADEVDHVIPLGEGGTDTDDNRRPIHATPCHQRKSALERARARRRARGQR